MHSRVKNVQASTAKSFQMRFNGIQSWLICGQYLLLCRIVSLCSYKLFSNVFTISAHSVMRMVFDILKIACIARLSFVSMRMEKCTAAAFVKMVFLYRYRQTGQKSVFNLMEDLIECFLDYWVRSSGMCA